MKWFCWAHVSLLPLHLTSHDLFWNYWTYMVDQIVLGIPSSWIATLLFHTSCTRKALTALRIVFLYVAFIMFSATLSPGAERRGQITKTSSRKLVFRCFLAVLSYPCMPRPWTNVSVHFSMISSLWGDVKVTRPDCSRCNNWYVWWYSCHFLECHSFWGMPMAVML